MDEIAKLTTDDILSTVAPTFKAYYALQRPRASIYLNGEHAPTEHSYGSYPRQKLDVYLPSSSSSSSGKLPTVLFFYGGGLVRGSKRDPNCDGAMYSNVGYYFASKGYVCAVVDYRLFELGKGIEDGGALFPSGGEDVALATRWVAENVEQVDANNIFIIGNSAGAVHISTYLWSDEAALGAQKQAVRGAILVSAPLSFAGANPERSKILGGYFRDDISGNCPVALRQKSSDDTTTAIILAERDPVDEIKSTNDEFLALFDEGKLDKSIRKPIVLKEMEGHNHLSPLMAVGLGGREDAWLQSVVEWIESQRA